MRHAILALIALLALPASAEELFGPVRATIVRVIDGDTLVVDARPWPGQTMRVHVRLRAVDAPETHGPACAAERQAAGQALELVERLVDEGGLELREIGRDKYAGRVVARVRAGGLDIGAELVRRGLARPYDGGARHSWCD